MILTRQWLLANSTIAVAVAWNSQYRPTTAPSVSFVSQPGHILSRQQGGSNRADNILWEVGADNLRRGARVMSGGEQIYIRFYNAVDSIVKSSGAIAKLGITATGCVPLH